MPISSPGVEILALDVERAVMAFHEAFRPRDDHRADRVRPHDVGIVVDLDAAQRAFDAEGSRRARPAASPGSALSASLRAKRLAGILAARLIDELAFLAALRHGDLDAWPARSSKASVEQAAILDLVRQQDEPRRRLVRVELREKGAEHLAGVEALVGAREIGAVAPVLTGAEEEHLDAELPGLFGDGENIGLLDAARIDALRALDGGERGDAVAQPRGALEFERFGRLFAFRSASRSRTARLLPDRKSRASRTSSA